VRPRESETVNLARRFLSLLRHRTLALHVLEGELPSGQPLRLVVADDHRAVPFIEHLLGAPQVTQSCLGRISALQAHKLDMDCDMVVATANRLLSRSFVRAGFHIVPVWVRLFIDLSIPPEELLRQLGGSVREDVRKVRSRGFTYEVTKDDRWLTRFYDSMYLPYAQSRYGSLAVVQPRARIRRLFEQGCLLIVKRDDVPVVGLLMIPDGPTLRCPYMGAVEDDFGSARHGGSAAFYWYGIQWAYSQGCKAINFGHSRAFLGDGVLRYKLKWGMRVVEDDDAVYDFAIKVMPGSGAGGEFLSANPFFHLGDGRLQVYSPETGG